MLKCRFTDFIDAEHKEQGIRAFAVHPGSVMTGDLHPTLNPALMLLVVPGRRALL